MIDISEIESIIMDAETNLPDLSEKAGYVGRGQLRTNIVRWINCKQIKLLDQFLSEFGYEIIISKKQE